MADMYDAYRSLIESYNQDDELTPAFGRTYKSRGFAEDDVEDFITSEDIVKKQKEEEEAKRKREEKFGATPIPTKGEPEEELCFKRFRTRHVHKYTESEMNAIREDCKTSIVHDYAEHDTYHMSDEERAEIDLLSDIRAGLKTVRSSYTNVAEYVRAMRFVIKAWEILEQKLNLLYDRDEFFKMVHDKRVSSPGIIIPKLKKMDQYDIDRIMMYISNPEMDENELLVNNNRKMSYDALGIAVPALNVEDYEDEYEDDDFFAPDKEEDAADDEDRTDKEEEVDPATKKRQEIEKKIKAAEAIRDESYVMVEPRETLDETINRLYTPEEQEMIARAAEHPEYVALETVKPKFIRGYDVRTFGYSHKKKKMSKNDRYFMEGIHELLQKVQNNPEVKAMRAEMTYSSRLMDSMFEPEDEYENILDKMPYLGSWTNDDQLRMYDAMVTEAMMNQPIPGNAYITYGELQTSEFFKALEEVGINTIELRRKMDMPVDGINSKTDAKRERKELKKKESAVLQRLTKLNRSDKFKKAAEKAEKKLTEHLEQ